MSAASKASCARYDKSRGEGDEMHAMFKYTLAALIDRKGYRSPEADKVALEHVRKYFNAPNFTPRLAYGLVAA